MLETFCDVFNVNWKSTTKGPLAHNPVHLEGPNTKESGKVEEIVKEVRRASITWVPEIVKQMAMI